MHLEPGQLRARPSSRVVERCLEGGGPMRPECRRSACHPVQWLRGGLDSGSAFRGLPRQGRAQCLRLLDALPGQIFHQPIKQGTILLRLAAWRTHHVHPDPVRSEAMRFERKVTEVDTMNELKESVGFSFTRTPDVFDIKLLRHMYNDSIRTHNMEDLL